MNENSLQAKLQGAWRLTDYFAESQNGSVFYPLGPDASGFIMYTHDAHMSATIMHPNRPAFESTDMMGATPNEQATAAAGYLSYAGTFVVDEANTVVTHQIKIALVPNWIGNEFKRKVILAGSKLELRALAPSLVAGEMRLVRVIWGRVR